MKKIDVGNLFSLFLPEGVIWSFEAKELVLNLVSKYPEFKVAIHILDNEQGEDRMVACRKCLEHYVRDVVGPPFLTNVQEISSDEWRGYQAVTAIKNGGFKINRCIAGPRNNLLLRIEFESDRDIDESLMQIVEGLVFIK